VLSQFCIEQPCPVCTAPTFPLISYTLPWLHVFMVFFSPPSQAVANILSLHILHFNSFGCRFLRASLNVTRGLTFHKNAGVWPNMIGFSVDVSISCLCRYCNMNLNMEWDTISWIQVLNLITLLSHLKKYPVKYSTYGSLMYLKAVSHI
jgi:hypothetical protein